MHAAVDSLSAGVHYATINVFLVVLSEKQISLFLYPYKYYIRKIIIVLKDLKS